MRNLWIFLVKYNAFFFFLIFFIISLVLVVNNNSYQHASAVNSSNFVVGEAYKTVDDLNSYLSLKRTNDRLAIENALLRKQLKQSFFNDKVEQHRVADTNTLQQYSYVVAKVINNSVNQKDNMITINRGTRHGIRKGMGVITSDGVVGVVKVTGDRFSTISSLLNSKTTVSATVAGSNAFGSIVWGDNNYDPRTAVLRDIPNHIVVKPGQRVVTTTESALYPAGHPIGVIKRTNKNSGGSFWDIEVKLNTDFASLDYVYVVVNLFAQQQLQVEDASQSVIPTP
jgi:rod shape-determining protein MreC